MLPIDCENKRRGERTISSFIWGLGHFADTAVHVSSVEHGKVSYPVVHLFGAVEDVHHDAQCPSQILGGLRLSCAGGPCWSTAHGEVEGLGERDVAAICEGRDHQASRVAKVLVRVLELGITDVGVAMLVTFSPSGGGNV